VQGTRGCRVSAEMTKTSAVGEATVAYTRPVRRGPGDGMHEQTRSSNWGPTRHPGGRRTKKISRRPAASGSDEAIVSIDLAGQHNRSASQGPLDRIAAGCAVAMPAWHLPFGAIMRRCRSLLLAVYKWVVPRRSRSNSCLKPYWGKPAVRNFRGGGGNTEAPSAFPTRLMDIGYPAC
jgi:hypothetical protein